MLKKRGSLLDQGCVLAFLVALMGYMPTARGSDRLVWVGTLALLLLRTLWLLVRREIRFAMDVNLFLYMLLFVWGLLSCFWSVSISDFRTYTTTCFPVVICAVVCLSAYIGQRIEPNRFLHLLILAGVLAGIRYCLYTDWSMLTSDYYLRGSFGRLLDDVTNYNNYTMVISGSCVLALYYAIVDNKRRFYVPAVILLGILLLGGSRKNIVTMPLIALIFTLFAGSATKRLKKLLMVLAVVAVALYLLMTLPALAQIQKAMRGMIGGLLESSEIEVDGSTQQRMQLIQWAIDVWAEHPLIGVGWNNYRFYNEARLYAHNNYAELLASLGIVGFLLYYAMFLRVGYILGSGFLHRRVRKEDVLLLGFSISMLIMEYGSITPYAKERLILMLVIFYWHSCVTRRKTYRFILK